MRRAALLETQVRRATENERTGITDAISSEEFLQYFTDAQLMIYRRMLSASAKNFTLPKIYSASGAETYALPGDIFGQSVISLEYSPTGAAKDYYEVPMRTHKERVSITGNPQLFFLGSSSIYVNPYPASGTFRLVYNKALPRVDKRRGTVLSHTKSSTALTALSLTGYTQADFDLYDHLTIVGFDGTVKMRGIPYTAAPAGVVAIQGSSYTFPEGSTLTNTTDYFCLGENASSHVQLPDFCEDFVLAYCAKRIMNRDSNDDAVEMSAEMIRMAEEIVDAWALPTQDIDNIPVVDTSYLLEY
jgi:hypothetical protein